jgi:hypothetical protein
MIIRSLHFKLYKSYLQDPLLYINKCFSEILFIQIISLVLLEVKMANHGKDLSSLKNLTLYFEPINLSKIIKLYTNSLYFNTS